MADGRFSVFTGCRGNPCRLPAPVERRLTSSFPKVRVYEIYYLPVVVEAARLRLDGMALRRIDHHLERLFQAR
jgi:hypothetical protein